MNGVFMSHGIDAISVPAAKVQEFNENTSVAERLAALPAGGAVPAKPACSMTGNSAWAGLGTRRQPINLRHNITTMEEINCDFARNVQNMNPLTF